MRFISLLANPLGHAEQAPRPGRQGRIDMRTIRNVGRRAMLIAVPALTWAMATSPAAPKNAKPAKTAPAPPMRVEKDLLGEKQIPGNAYYGVQTARGMENFQLSGVLINHYPGYIEAW